MSEHDDRRRPRPVEIDRLIDEWVQRSADVRQAMTTDATYHAGVMQLTHWLHVFDRVMIARSLIYRAREAIVRDVLTAIPSPAEAHECQEHQRRMVEFANRWTVPTRVEVAPADYQAMLDRHSKSLLEPTAADGEICIDPNRRDQAVIDRTP